MFDMTKMLLALLALALVVLPVAGCGSKVVVGRSIADYPQYTEEQAQPAETIRAEPETAQVKPTEAVQPAPETAKPEPEPPKPETAQAEPEKPAPSQPAGAEPSVEKPETEAPAEQPAEKPAPEAGETGGVPAEPPAAERKPTVTPSSSRREALPEDGSAPYELDLSFGGFGLSQGLFDSPVAIAVDEDENMYVVDQGNFRIQKFDRFGLFQFAWGRQGLGDGEFTVSGTGGGRELRMTGVFEFNRPLGILLDTDDGRDLVRITVVDSLNHRLQRFLLTRNEGELFPDDVFVKLKEGDGNVPDTELKDRYEVERIPVILDPVYINEAKADSTFLTAYVWGGLGFSQGLMNAPSYLAKDAAGVLYVSDTGNGRVQGFNILPENPPRDTTFFREFGNLLENDYGAGRLFQPTALVYDNTGYGSFLALDEKRDSGHVIQRFDREGEFIGIFVETGGKAGQLRQPVSMAVSPFDNTVYVTDRGHRKVMVYNNKGDFLFAFGGEELSDPRGIAVLRNNYVYVTDAAKNMVYRYIPK